MLYFEDIPLNREESAGPVTLTASEIIDFARRWDPHAFHTDKETADQSIFGGVSAAACHLICVANRLFHDMERVAVLAALAQEFRYPNPARAGDHLTLFSACVEKRESRSRPGCGIVSLQSRVMNQDGIVVLEMKSAVMVAKRPAVSPA